MNDKEKTENRYIDKTLKIDNYKKSKMEKLNLISTKNKQELKESQKNHAERFSLLKNEIQAKQEEYEKEVEEKLNRTRKSYIALVLHRELINIDSGPRH